MPVNVQSDILKHLQDQVECRFHLLNALLNHGRLLFYHVEDTTKGWRPAILTNMALLSERLSTIEDLQKSSQTNFNALLDKTNRHAQSMTKIHESLNSLDQKINDRQKTTDNQLKKISDRQKTTDDQLKKIIALLSSDEEKRSRSCSCILSTLTLTRQAIIIPIIDADNDEVRCRFDKDSAECTGVCPPNSLPNGTLILLNCALPITGSESSDWYIVAVMIEDFIESTSKDTTEQYSYSIFSSCPSNNMQSNQYYATFTVAENDVPLCPEHFFVVMMIIQLWQRCNNMQSNQYYATFTVAENDVPLCPEHYDDNSTLAALVTSRSTSPWFWIGPILAVLLLC
ncbi:unnamed protein product [Adineta ricciae]|uniref:Uncharacterized protein n=1 Tax=Adineta ricciae TaxID=249248 RepID=A0A814PS83_ADIRI|nr:unnamed protein product [Adineta ricciae]